MRYDFDTYISDIQCKSVTVESTRNEPTRKEVKDNNFVKAEITFVNNIESLGEVECRLGTNIFWTADYIYVEDGCKAKLDVCYRPTDRSTLPAGTCFQNFVVLIYFQNCYST